MDTVRTLGVRPDVICACGPVPMLRAVKQYGRELGVKTFVSLEERMGCGIGACLSCVCDSEETDPHLNVRKKRICTEGPVFDATEVIL